MTPKSIFLLIIFISISKIFIAQNSFITVSSTLTNEKGKPLLVFIHSYNSSGIFIKSVKTDNKGFYSIDAPKGKRLTVAGGYLMIIQL